MFKRLSLLSYALLMSMLPAFGMIKSNELSSEETSEKSTKETAENCTNKNNVDDEGINFSGGSPGVVVDLRYPEFNDGVLTTTQGGVITAGTMRIQAQRIVYTRKVSKKCSVNTIVAEGDLLVEYGDYFFIGTRLEYDFESKCGFIYQGRTLIEPWFFGGELISLHKDGSYTIQCGYLTTAPSRDITWKISAEEILLWSNRDFNAKHLKLELGKQPVLWLPSLRGNINNIAENTMRYSFYWGRQGPRFCMYYQLFSWRRFKAFLRFDYRVSRGPAGGIETNYTSEDHKESFDTINYIACDSPLEHPHQHYRYRFQGDYQNKFNSDKVSVKLSYDKLSDNEMASDYKERSLELDYPEITMLQVRRQEDNWIGNLWATVRINSFQTVNQQLPTFEFSVRPFKIASTGIISDCRFRASYLEFKYANNICDASDYCSTRIAYTHKLYRPLHFASLIVTPEVTGLLIYYGKVPNKNHRWLTLGIANCTAQLPFHRIYRTGKHVMTPYIAINSYTYPTLSPRDHYIFDIDDGWFRLNMVRCGIRQDFYTKGRDGLMARLVALDFYANGFINCHNLPLIPKLYAVATVYPNSRLKYVVDIAWDCQHQIWDYFNIRTAWTVSSNLALTAEYRHRSEFDWRKADRENFFLDAFRSEKELLHSPLSDQRDTLLFHLYWRLGPQWAIAAESRQGWNRQCAPPYREYGINLIGRLQSSWRIKLSYQHREDDGHRVVVHFKLIGASPAQEVPERPIPILEF